LENAKRHSADKSSIYSLFIEKWFFITALFASPNSSASKLEFSKFRKRVERSKNWSILRELDLYQALASEDDMEISKVYLKTQNRFYKKKISKLAGPEWRLTSPIALNNSVSSSQSGVTPFQIKPESLLEPLLTHPRLLRLFQVLITDQYTPFYVGMLFSELFPDEFFDPYHSKNRIHQILRRLRQLIQEQKWSIEIIHESSSYRMNIGDEFPLLLIESDPNVISKYDIDLAKLESSRQTNFSASEIQSFLNCNRSKAVRVLNAGIDQHRIVKEGAGKNTRYLIKALKAS
ncbi:MAG: hypothetical protein AAF202_09465, partial [Pseudomonadota bacterium]